MTARLRILIAADDITAASTLGALLRHSSHELRVAPDNKGAVDLAKAWAPHVALVDLEMPGVQTFRRDMDTHKIVEARIWVYDDVFVNKFWSA